MRIDTPALFGILCNQAFCRNAQSGSTKTIEKQLFNQKRPAVTFITA
jgi:hypothetical protein